MNVCGINVGIREHDSVVLTADIPAHGLENGDFGTVVLIHQAAPRTRWTLDGETVAVVSLPASQVRPISRKEIAHARALETYSRRRMAHAAQPRCVAPYAGSIWVPC